MRRAHEAPDSPSVWLSAGDEVRVGERHGEWSAFVFVSCAGGSGWVPARHLSQAHGEAVVMEAYDTTELPTGEGEVLEVIYDDDLSGWVWCRSSTGREGWVPDNTVGGVKGS